MLISETNRARMKHSKFLDYPWNKFPLKVVVQQFCDKNMLISEIVRVRVKMETFWDDSKKKKKINNKFILVVWL